ncbi:MAG TPA: hypothetical protein VED63_02610 [Acidimicrobiales bacterium]|nr:hypothetical protein [Acidimicrobiales bacterium]
MLPAPFRLEASRFRFAEDVEGIGFQLYDDVGEVLCRASSTPDLGVYAVRVVGIPHHPDSQKACFAAGSPVVLRRDPTNWTYPSPIKVLDSAGRRELGLVSKSDVGCLPCSLEALQGIVLTEYVRDDKRVGATALFVDPGPGYS